MDKLTGDRERVWKAIEDTIRDLRSKGDAAAADRLQQAYDRERANPASGDAWYMPKSPELALFQSAMQQRIENGLAAAWRRDDVMPAEGVSWEQFNDSDPGWLEVVKDKLATLARGPHPFLKHRALTDFQFPIVDRVKLALVADWGAGNAQAKQVMDQVVERRPDHVIHLGDVYYAGEPGEVQSRFLDWWPKDLPPKRSWALNGNHEMYSGGYGYFDRLLLAFDQPASYFALHNTAWQIIALDTAYKNADLYEDQGPWLQALLADPTRKSILLSHHQLFSVYAPVDGALGRSLDALGALRGPLIWFWGHEHRCVVYERYQANGWDVTTRCIGHGAIPYPMQDLPGDPGAAGPRIAWDNRRERPDAPGFGIHGFALLTLSGDRLTVTYIDQDGKGTADPIFA